MPFIYLKKADGFIYFPDPLWNIFRRSGSASRSPYTGTKMSAVTAVERMLACENGKALSRKLRKFYVQRMLTILGNAFLANKDAGNDILLLRKKLRKNFWSYMILQKSFKLKLIYVLEAFGPKRLARFLLVKRKKSLAE